MNFHNEENDKDCLWPKTCWKCELEHDIKVSMEGDYHRDWPLVKIAFWSEGKGKIWKFENRAF